MSETIQTVKKLVEQLNNIVIQYLNSLLHQYIDQ